MCLPDGSTCSTDSSCVFPISHVDGMLWARGLVSDTDLVLKAPLITEGAFLVNLPDLQSYRPVLRQIARLKAEGAVFMILRTGNDVITKHLLEKNPGCVRCFEERDGTGRHRYLVPPETFARWTAKFT